MAPENEYLPLRPEPGRRKFISTLAKGAGAAAFLTLPASAVAGPLPPLAESWTVGQIMDLFIKEVPRGPIENTVDTLKAGNREMKVKALSQACLPVWR